MEGGIRTPCVIRWSGRIRSGQVSNDIVHEVDLFATLLAAAGASDKVPIDRAFDGVNQLPFFEGKQPHSARESTLFMNARGDVMAVKWHDWKLWYYFKTELPDPQPDNLVRLFDLRVDPGEENDVKDYYPWVVGIMDNIVKQYEESLIQYPRVPASAQDPYTAPAKGSGSPVLVYHRTDRALKSPRSTAMPTPDFSGSWSTTVLHTVSPLVRGNLPEIPDLGSGWGEKISIAHKDDYLEIERVVFVPREIQPLVKYRFALDGTKTENALPTGRTGNVPSSTTAWDGNRLVITTLYPLQDPKSGDALTAKVTQTLWLQPATGTPWEPTLVVETTRERILNGLISTNRTVYTKGYR
jgi:hypothetical protein